MITWFLGANKKYRHIWGCETIYAIAEYLDGSGYWIIPDHPDDSDAPEPQGPFASLKAAKAAAEILQPEKYNY